MRIKEIDKLFGLIGNDQFIKICQYNTGRWQWACHIGGVGSSDYVYGCGRTPSEAIKSAFNKIKRRAS